MPNRIIKESIHESERLSKLSDFEFRLWVNLIVYVDDYGRGDARPAIIKGNCFPLRERLTNSDIKAALQKLADTGCVALYNVDGRPYLYFPRWESHQRVQTKKSKYPAPPESTVIHGDSRLFTVSHGESPPESNPIQSNPNTNPNTNPYYCTEQTDVGSVLNLPLNDGSLFGITQDQVDKWAGLYPAVDIMQELRNMRGWLDSNPKKRKTKTGILRFVNGWLSREQDKPHFDKKSNVRQTTFHNLDERKDDIEDFALKKMMAELEE